MLKASDARKFNLTSLYFQNKNRIDDIFYIRRVMIYEWLNDKYGRPIFEKICIALGAIFFLLNV